MKEKEAALKKEIKERFLDRQARMVYADWLKEHDREAEGEFQVLMTKVIQNVKEFSDGQYVDFKYEVPPTLAAAVVRNTHSAVNDYLHAVTLWLNREDPDEELRKAFLYCWELWWRPNE